MITIFAIHLSLLATAAAFVPSHHFRFPASACSSLTSGRVHKKKTFASTVELPPVPPEEDYQAYREREEIFDRIRTLPLFKSVCEDEDFQRVKDDLVKVSVTKGQEVISQGDSIGDEDAMYFLQSGALEARVNGKRVKGYHEFGDYFGELALFFSQPRAASIVSTRDSVLWALKNKDIRFPVGKVPESIIVKKYNEDSFRDTLPKLSYEEVVDLIIAKSRPKKKSVSAHSTLSTVAIGGFIAIAASLWQPGIDEFGYPMLFNILDHIRNSAIINSNRVVGLALAITAVAGIFRIPKRTPETRLRIFSLLSWLTCFFYVISDSNLGGLVSGGFTFDAFAFRGNFVIGGVFLGTLYQCLLLVDDAVAGPMKGKGTIPLQSPRMAAIISCLFSSQVLGVLCIFVMPMLGGKEWYENTLALVWRDDGFTGTVVNTCVFGEALLGIGALIATLQFERKVDVAKANVSFVVVSILTMYDAFRFFYFICSTYLWTRDFSVMNEKVPHLKDAVEALLQLNAEFHLLELWWLLNIGACVFGGLKLYSQ